MAIGFCVDRSRGAVITFGEQHRDLGELRAVQGADDAALGQIFVDGAGFNLNFPVLDVDLYVPALVAGVFGTSAWMRRGMARLAGPSTRSILYWRPEQPPPMTARRKAPLGRPWRVRSELSFSEAFSVILQSFSLPRVTLGAGD